jgi:hypothetical protein
MAQHVAQNRRCYLNDAFEQYWTTMLTHLKIRLEPTSLRSVPFIGMCLFVFLLIMPNYSHFRFYGHHLRYGARVLGVLPHDYGARNEIYIHWHFGATGGTAIRNFFVNSPYSVSLNPVRTETLKGLCQTNQYVEFHCDYSLSRAVQVIAEIKSRVKRCSTRVTTFTVLRNPLDALCSAQRHHHQDYVDFLQDKVHNPFIMHAKYGVTYCARENISSLEVNMDDVNIAAQHVSGFDLVLDFYDLSSWFNQTFNHSLTSRAPSERRCELPHHVRFPILDQVLYYTQMRHTNRVHIFNTGSAEMDPPSPTADPAKNFSDPLTCECSG